MQKLYFSNGLAGLQGPVVFAKYVAPVSKTEWVVYATPPFGGPERMLEYLGRHTRRLPISNSRRIDVGMDKLGIGKK